MQITIKGDDRTVRLNKTEVGVLKRAAGILAAIERNDDGEAETIYHLLARLRDDGTLGPRRDVEPGATP